MQQLPPPPTGVVVPAQAVQATNTLAVVSLISGVVGYVLPHPFIAGIVAIITGHMARGQIRRTGEGGAKLALIGLVLGYVHLALSILIVGALALLIVFGLWSFGHSQPAV